MKNKSWILFFTEDGINPCGSDWSHCVNLNSKNAERRIFSKGYCIPPKAKSYIILTEYQFNTLNYEQIEEYNKKYGKQI